MRAAHMMLVACLVAACGDASSPNERDRDVQPVPRPARGLPTTPPPSRPTRAPTSPLEELQFGVVGRWIGTATSPTDATRTFRVWFDLHVDGRYSAGCVDSTCVNAFGEPIFNDADHPTKRYAIYDLTDSEKIGVGEIGVLLGDNVEAVLQTRRATLHNVMLSFDKNSLGFDLRWFPGSPYELRYDLRRSLP